MTETTAAGTLAKPIPVHANGKPARCLFDDCGGGLVTRGPLWLCLACGAWFTLAGPLSDDDRAEIEERAAIKEYDAGMTRDRAEIEAANEYREGAKP